MCVFLTFMLTHVFENEMNEERDGKKELRMKRSERTRAREREKELPAIVGKGGVDFAHIEQLI